MLVAARGTAVGLANASGKINLNQATAADLEELPGIGPAIAARIVDFRDSNGSFSSVDALGDVPGIGPATVEELRNLVTV